MGMRIDAARNNQLSGGVDDMVGLDRNIAANQIDAVFVDKNVGMVIVRGRHDAAIFYEYAQPILPENAGFRFACGIPGGILMNFAFHIHPAYYTVLTKN
jgi:hypothetical protein